MSDPSPVTRREALMTAAALGVVGGVADASPEAEEDPSDPSEKNGKHKPGVEIGKAVQIFEIQATVGGGEIVTLHPSELIIDFGAAGKLRVTPSGILPVGNHGKNPSNQNKPGDDQKQNR